MTLAEVTQLIFDTYSAEPEHLFARAPGYAAFRHADNGKWFAVAMEDIPCRALGMNRDGWVDILNVKCDPLLVTVLRARPGYRPAYHMNKNNWISILLDGSAGPEEIETLLETSFALTGRKARRKTQRQTEKGDEHPDGHAAAHSGSPE